MSSYNTLAIEYMKDTCLIARRCLPLPLPRAGPGAGDRGDASNAEGRAVYIRGTA